MEFFEVNQVVWIFSCFLLSKIAYNQRKAKNRLMITYKLKNAQNANMSEKRPMTTHPKLTSDLLVLVFGF
ncbi:hypothetical protein HpBT274_15420 [Helicobacter pylori]